MARTKKKIEDTPEITKPQYAELPDIIVVDAPLVDITQQIPLFHNAEPARYTLQYNTYNSIHLVSVYWDGETLLL